MANAQAVTQAVAQEFIANWHRFFETRDQALANELFAENAALLSPAFFTPKHNKAYAIAIATTALEVFEDFCYVGEWINGDGVILEFEARVGEHKLKGIDRFTIDAQGRITALEILIRPLNALTEVAQRMKARLAPAS